MKRHPFILTLPALGASLALFACGQNDLYHAGIGSEVAITAISGSTDATESLIAYQAPVPASAPGGASRLAKLKGELRILPSAWAIPSCDWNSLITGCTNNVSTLSFDRCSVLSDPAIAISGSETFAWTGTGCCTTNPLTASSATPCTFNRRTVKADGTADPLIRSIGSHAITLNTEDVSGYNQPKTGGFLVACQGDGQNATCDGQRQITIAGAHYLGDSGHDQWDHTVSTDEPIVVQGHGGGRRVLSGKIRVQHNIAHYSTVTTIETQLVHRSGCCLPVGGKVTTTFEGGKQDGKTEAMTFGPGCGEATLNDVNQQRTGLTLHHCL